jgi:hypothetical protein
VIEDSSISLVGRNRTASASMDAASTRNDARMLSRAGVRAFGLAGWHSHSSRAEALPAAAKQAPAASVGLNMQKLWMHVSGILLSMQFERYVVNAAIL